MAKLAAKLAALLGGTAGAYPTGPGEVAHPGEACAAALELLLSAFDDADTLRALLCSYVTRIDAIETALLQVHYNRWLDTAAGAQLDVLGRILKEPRNGASDTVYRRGLRSRVLANSSNGKIEELLLIALTFEPDLDSVEARQLYPYAITFWALGQPEADPRALAQRLQQASAGAVGLQMVHTPLGSASLHAISADTTPTTSATQGFGSTTESTGGGLASVIGH